MTATTLTATNHDGHRVDNDNNSVKFIITQELKLCGHIVAAIFCYGLWPSLFMAVFSVANIFVAVIGHRVAITDEPQPTQQWFTHLQHSTILLLLQQKNQHTKS